MKINIEYCMQWNYEPNAFRARDRIAEKHDACVTLTASGGGKFEITVAGRLAFSKKATGRFPTDTEIDEIT